jgi:phage-related protein
VAPPRQPILCFFTIAMLKGSERTAKGRVSSCYLRANALSHTVTIDAEEKDIAELKEFMRTAPEYKEGAYRWPLERESMKFTSRKNSAKEFEPVWRADEDAHWENVSERGKGGGGYERREVGGC